MLWAVIPCALGPRASTLGFVFLKIKDLACTWGVQPVHVMGYCGRDSFFCMLCRSKILHDFLFVLLADRQYITLGPVAVPTSVGVTMFLS